jgi:hypothetical protein
MTVMDERYAKQFTFQYPYLVMARVTGVYNLSKERKLSIDAIALDGRGNWQKVPVALPAGVTRLYRKGQIVGLLFRHGASNFPSAVCHIYNVESDPKYTDPVPPPFENVDDQVYYHPETGAFIRHRSSLSTPVASAGDGTPAITEVTTASGHQVILDESPGYQSVTVKSASGHTTKLDDVLKTVTTLTAAGHKFTMDDLAQTITHQTIGQTETVIMDKVTAEIATVANSVGLGDRVANLPASTAAIANVDLTTFSHGVDVQRLKDMITMGGHIAAAGIPNAGALVAILAGLGPLSALSVPPGSTTVKVKP